MQGVVFNHGVPRRTCDEMFVLFEVRFGGYADGGAGTRLSLFDQAPDERVTSFSGRGSRQRNLGKCRFYDEFKFPQLGPSAEILKFQESLQSNQDPEAIQDFLSLISDAFDRIASPSSAILNSLSRLREEPENDDGSSADENVSPKGSGWRGCANDGRYRLQFARTLRWSDLGFAPSMPRCAAQVLRQSALRDGLNQLRGLRTISRI